MKEEELYRMRIMFLFTEYTFLESCMIYTDDVDKALFYARRSLDVNDWLVYETIQRLKRGDLS